MATGDILVSLAGPMMNILLALVFTAALAVSLVVPLSTLSAQSPPIEPGARVRVKQECFEGYTSTSRNLTTVCPTNTGVLTAMTAESIIFATGNGGNRLAVPLDSVTRLEVIQGRSRHPWRGAGIGLLVGAAGGAVGTLIMCRNDGCWDYGTGFWVARLSASGAVVGAVMGGIVGTFIKTDRWEEVPLDRLRVSFAPQRDGRYKLGLRLTF